MSFGVGLELGEYAIRDHLIEGSYGNPNNVAVVLAMLLMVLVMSGYVRMSCYPAPLSLVATSGGNVYDVVAHRIGVPRCVPRGRCAGAEPAAS